MSHRPMGMEIMAVPAGYPCGFLTPMLEGMKAKGDHGRSGFGVEDAKNAAFLTQFVVVERVGRKHGFLMVHCRSCPHLSGGFRAHIVRQGQFVACLSQKRGQRSRPAAIFVR
jgi:hypothetical protein